MIKLIVFCMLFSFSAFANWQVEVALGVDGQTWKIQNAKFEDGKETTLLISNYILKMTIKKSKVEKAIEVSYTVQEKKGDKIILLNKGEDMLEDRPANDIFAKGEPNQPNSIITLKMKPL